MSKFFYPFIGKDYNQGINGKRVLILGASFYCPKVDCNYYKQCTDTKTKDSSTYDIICPEYYGKGLRSDYINNEACKLTQPGEIEIRKSIITFR